jgi:hypothetical protein
MNAKSKLMCTARSLFPRPAPNNVLILSFVPTTTVTLISEQPTFTVYYRTFLRPSFRGTAAREQHLDVVIVCAGI